LGFTDLFRRRKEDPDAEPGVSNAPGFPTKALGRFIGVLSTRQQPILLDLGPVVGSNVNYFGEQLGCKIFVEDLSKDIDRHAKDGKLEEFPAFLAKRFPQEDNTFDGILCWDVVDFLDRASARALATELQRILKPDGVLLAMFNATEQMSPEMRSHYVRHVVVDHDTLEHRPYRAVASRLKPLPNRDIQRVFDPLRIAEQFLLKTNVREVLFRKPA
jgi:SAM-dependent methyltransferase